MAIPNINFDIKEINRLIEEAKKKAAAKKKPSTVEKKTVAVAPKVAPKRGTQVIPAKTQPVKRTVGRKEPAAPLPKTPGKKPPAGGRVIAARAEKEAAAKKAREAAAKKAAEAKAAKEAAAKKAAEEKKAAANRRAIAVREEKKAAAERARAAKEAAAKKAAEEAAQRREDARRAAAMRDAKNARTPARQPLPQKEPAKGPVIDTVKPPDDIVSRGTAGGPSASKEPTLNTTPFNRLTPEEEAIARSRGTVPPDIPLYIPPSENKEPTLNNTPFNPMTPEEEEIARSRGTVPPDLPPSGNVINVPGVGQIQLPNIDLSNIPSGPMKMPEAPKAPEPSRAQRRPRPPGSPKSPAGRVIDEEPSLPPPDEKVFIPAPTVPTPPPKAPPPPIQRVDPAPEPASEFSYDNFEPKQISYVKALMGSLGLDPTQDEQVLKDLLENQFGSGAQVSADTLSKTFGRSDGKSLLSAIGEVGKYQDYTLPPAADPGPEPTAPTPPKDELVEVRDNRFIDENGNGVDDRDEPAPPTAPTSPIDNRQPLLDPVELQETELTEPAPTPPKTPVADPDPGPSGGGVFDRIKLPEMTGSWQTGASGVYYELDEPMRDGTTTIWERYDPETDTYHGRIVGGFTGTMNEPTSKPASEMDEGFKKAWENYTKQQSQTPSAPGPAPKEPTPPTSPLRGNEDPSLANTVAPPEFGQPPNFKFTAEPVPRINPNWNGLEEWKKQQSGGASESAPPTGDSKDEPKKEPTAPKPPTFINMDPLKGLRETFVPRNLLGQTYDPKVREDYEKDVDKARPNFYQRIPGQTYANPVYQTPTIAVPQTQFGGYGQPMPMAPLAPYAGLGGSRGMYAGEEEEEPRPGGPSTDPYDGVY